MAFNVENISGLNTLERDVRLSSFGFSNVRKVFGLVKKTKMTAACLTNDPTDFHADVLIDRLTNCFSTTVNKLLNQDWFECWFMSLISAVYNRQLVIVCFWTV